MRKTVFVLAAVSTYAMATPGWATGCPVEPSPVDCTAGRSGGVPQQIQTQQIRPFYQPPPAYPPPPVYRPYTGPSQSEIDNMQLRHILSGMSR